MRKRLKTLVALALTAVLVGAELPKVELIVNADEPEWVNPALELFNYDYFIGIGDGYMEGLEENLTVEYTYSGGGNVETTENAQLKILEYGDFKSVYYVFNNPEGFDLENLTDESLKVTIRTNKVSQIGEPLSFWYANIMNASPVLLEWQDPNMEENFAPIYTPDFENGDPDFDPQLRDASTNGVYEFDINLAEKPFEDEPYYFNFGLYYPSTGNEDIVEATNSNMYAYTSGIDFNDDGNADIDDIKYMLARELVDKFLIVDSYGQFGIDYEWFDDIEADNYDECVDKMLGKIDISVSGTAEAKDSFDDVVSIDKYEAAIVWGTTEDGETTISTIFDVYTLPNIDDVLICTDYDDEIGSGSQFYVRTVGSDDVDFSQDNDMGLFISSDFSNVKVAANGGYVETYEEQENYKSIEIRNEGFIGGFLDAAVGFGDYSRRVRVMKPSGTFIALHTSGESLRVDGMNANGYEQDPICETGDGITANVYIGNDEITFSPLNANLNMENSEIVEITLDDESYADGVVIDDTDLNNVKVTFKSNYFDCVTFNIKYVDGTVKPITIQRVGLVLRYQFLDDSGEYGVSCDCYEPWNPENESAVAPVTYDYYSGEQILVYATYYHPSNDATLSGSDNMSLMITCGDGTSRIISCVDNERGFNGNIQSTNGAVATTSFIIDFLQSAEQLEDGNWGDMIVSQNYKEGLNAIVLNGGFDDDTSCGGVQIGSGLGVYWDGNVEWVRR